MRDGTSVMTAVEWDGENAMIVRMRLTLRVKIAGYHFVKSVMGILELFCAISVSDDCV